MRIANSFPSDFRVSGVVSVIEPEWLDLAEGIGRIKSILA